VVGGCRRLHDEEPLNLHTSPNTIRVIEPRRMRWTGHVCHVGKIRNVHKDLVRKSEEKRPLERPGHAWDDNIRMDLKRNSCGLGSPNSEKGPVVGSHEHSTEPSGSIKGRNFLTN